MRAQLTYSLTVAASSSRHLVWRSPLICLRTPPFSAASPRPRTMVHLCRVSSLRRKSSPTTKGIGKAAVGLVSRSSGGSKQPECRLICKATDYNLADMTAIPHTYLSAPGICALLSLTSCTATARVSLTSRTTSAAGCWKVSYAPSKDS